MDMQLVAWMAASLVFASFFMKTIVPLRTLAIVSNIVFIGYALLGVHHGIFDKVLPIFVLHVALLPLNLARLREALRNSHVPCALQTQGNPHESLIPYMTALQVKAGVTLFRRGDNADTIFLVSSGSIHLTELNKRLVAGDLFGEAAIFSTRAKRSTTAVCEVDCELFFIQGKRAMELFYVDRALAFQFTRAIAHDAAESSDRTPGPIAEPAY